jgi:hypothetical protein
MLVARFLDMLSASCCGFIKGVFERRGFAAMVKNFVYALALVLITASWTDAAPVLISISGNFSEGSTAIVTGSGFGTKSPAAPVKWDNFNSGSNGSRLNSSTWPVQTAQGGSTYPTYNNSVLRAGDTMSCKVAIQSPQYNCSFGYDTTGKQKWYISYWRRDTETGSTDNYKHFRIYGDGVSGELPEAYYTELTAGSAVFGVTDENLSTAPMNQWISQGAKNTWIREEFYFDMGTRGQTNGKAAMWVNGQEWVNKSFASAALLSGYTGELTSPRIGHYFRTSLGGGLTSYLSEAYIDNTQARVEIGDSASWNNCNHREIQIPSAWSTNSITIRVNQGSFEAGQTAYLFVVDASGAVNSQGYQIVIGGSASGGGGGGGTPPSAPSAPQELRVQ